MNLQRQCGASILENLGACQAFFKVFCMVTFKAISRVPMIKNFKSILKYI